MRFRTKVHYSPITGEWSISEKTQDRANVKANNTYGTTRINGYKILEETLNLRDVRIFDYMEDSNGKRTPVLNKKETAIAQGKQELIKEAFREWIWKDPQRRERLCTLYNEKFNSNRPREYDGSHLQFPGMNPEIRLRPHQVNAIAHILRSALIQRGMPEEEIAYIHDASTEAKKKELFSKVRSGQVRVLLGSTQKMGAGTNVQERLVALHHLDCPWRPSDLQQREGRIVRQGNMHDQVEIYTYVTENTFDSYLYQLVESKQKFIGQIMTSKSPVRSAEDIDETALSYAEIKALCTGNPYIKEKMDLDIEVQKLRLLKSSHQSQQYALEDQILKTFPQQIRSFELTIAGLETDIATAEQNTHPNEEKFSPMVLEGKTHTEKKSAGSAILEICHNMQSPDPVHLGNYRGFDMQLHFDTFYKEFKITLQGALSYSVALGTDIYGNIQRLDNMIDSFSERLENCKVQLENVQCQLATAKSELGKPFAREEELRQKSARLDELNILLNLDKTENEIVDADVGDDNDEPTPMRSTQERV